MMRARFLRIWRGELSLPKTFWIVCVLGIIGIWVTTQLISALIAKILLSIFTFTQSVLVEKFFVIPSLGILQILYAAFALISTFRSANHHKSRTVSPLTVKISAIVLFLVFLRLIILKMYIWLQLPT
jgi:hypothetical protein